MSYGFAPDVLPSQVPNLPIHTGGGHPNIGWAMTSDTSSFDSDVTAVTREEVPCQSIFVPEDEMPIYGNYYVSRIPKTFSF